MAIIPYKKEMKKCIRNNLPTVKEIAGPSLKGKSSYTKKYRDNMLEVLNRGLKNLKLYGTLPYKFKHMQLSPRIIPLNYGQSINGVKKLLRMDIYQRIANLNPRYTIVDFDLKSCYPSILLGLIPDPMEIVKQALEKDGLWNYIKREFEKNGVPDQYDKPAVNICVYSSFFFGGNKAMAEGIVESVRQDCGMSKKEFRESPDFGIAEKNALKVPSQMQNSNIISCFREASTYLREVKMGEFLIGPTGHKYKIDNDPDSFNNGYTNLLQSYEFYLLASATLSVKEQFPEIEVIGHYHDGNVFAITNNQVKEVSDFYNSEVKNFAKKVHLSYPQEMKISNTF